MIECGTVKAVTASTLTLTINHCDPQWAGETDAHHAARVAKFSKVQAVPGATATPATHHKTGAVPLERLPGESKVDWDARCEAHLKATGYPAASSPTAYDPGPMLANESKEEYDLRCSGVMDVEFGIDNTTKWGNVAGYTDVGVGDRVTVETKDDQHGLATLVRVDAKAAEEKGGTAASKKDKHKGK